MFMFTDEKHNIMLMWKIRKSRYESIYVLDKQQS